jgi:hypothetical protein
LAARTPGSIHATALNTPTAKLPTQSAILDGELVLIAVLPIFTA